MNAEPNASAEVEASLSSSQLCERLGRATGYVLAPKNVFSNWGASFWVVKRHGEKALIVARDSPPWWLSLVLVLVIAAIVGVAMVLPVVAGVVMGVFVPLGWLACAGALFGLWGVTWSCTWAKRGSLPLVVLDAASRTIRIRGRDQSVLWHQIVRVEIVSAAYVHDDSGDVVPERHLVLCVRETPTSLRWLGLTTGVDGGLRRVAKAIGAMLGVPVQQTYATRLWP